ncbi:MAG TPA: hypothetical protein VL098_00440 [Flavipsychrobacter sp.]|nr:hypothetical protein [Flavipsychrobacter sp.]
MYKNSLGELKLLPIKLDGKFVFLNDTLRVNGKTSKGDHIKILADHYHIVAGKHLISKGATMVCEMVVRGEKMQIPCYENLACVEDFYDTLSESYKKLFYFGNGNS